MFTTIPPLRAIIADDSPEILALMRSLVEEVAPTLEIVATCTSLAEVDLAIKKFAPQLLYRQGVATLSYRKGYSAYLSVARDEYCIYPKRPDW